MNRVIVRTLCRLVVAGVFAFAGISKALHEPSPPSDATMYDAIVRGRFVVHYAIVAAELLLACWLLSGWATQGSALAAICTLSLFSGLILVEITRERPKPCGCSTSLSLPTSVEAIRRSLIGSLAFNATMMAIAAMTIRWNAPTRGNGTA